MCSSFGDNVTGKVNVFVTISSLVFTVESSSFVVSSGIVMDSKFVPTPYPPWCSPPLVVFSEDELQLWWDVGWTLLG